MISRGQGLVDESAINIFTDGSCQMHKQRKGGIGICFVTVDDTGEERIDDTYNPPGWLQTTNQQMELMACIVGITEINQVYPNPHQYSNAIVFTDSMYVKDHFNTARFRWSKKKWLKSSGAPVENSELWAQLLKSYKNALIKIEFEWVKGHKNNKYNKIADKLAKESAQNAIHPPLIETHVAPKLSTEKTKAGSIDMCGQEVAIRIIERKSMPNAKTFKYRYEIIDTKSKDFGSIDFIHYENKLSRWTKLRARLNDNQKFPQILKILEYID